MLCGGNGCGHWEFEWLEVDGGLIWEYGLFGGRKRASGVLRRCGCVLIAEICALDRFGGSQSAVASTG